VLEGEAPSVLADGLRSHVENGHVAQRSVEMMRSNEGLGGGVKVLASVRPTTGHVGCRFERARESGFDSIIHGKPRCRAEVRQVVKVASG
jgi:hypothetical protein